MCGTCLALGAAQNNCVEKSSALNGPAAASGSTVVNDEQSILYYLDGGNNFRWNATSSLGSSVIVTYSFSNGASGDNPYNASSFSEFTLAQKANFRKAAAEFMAASGLILMEVQSGGMMDVYNAHGTAVGGYADIPWVSNYYMPDVDIVIDSSGSYGTGSYGYYTLLHELGHAVGFDHTFSGAYTLNSALDSTRNSVMSYNYDSSVSGLRYIDQAALQTLYGTSQTSGFTIGTANGTRLLLDGSGAVDNFATPTGPGGNAIGVKIFGRGGNDDLTGGSGSDKLRGNQGNDTLDGGSGNDFLRGGAGSDVLNGGSGNDYLNGGKDGDTINGDGGNDTLLGRHGNDTLNGGSGNDTLDGGIGSDILTGGSGTDQFIFAADSGSDRITDFNANGELLDFRGSGFDFSDVTVSNVSGGATVDVGGVSIMLDGVNASMIDANDFIFV